MPLKLLCVDSARRASFGALKLCFSKTAPWQNTWWMKSCWLVPQCNFWGFESGIDTQLSLCRCRSTLEMDFQICPFTLVTMQIGADFPPLAIVNAIWKRIFWCVFSFREHSLEWKKNYSWKDLTDGQKPIVYSQPLLRNYQQVEDIFKLQEPLFSDPAVAAFPAVCPRFSFASHLCWYH